MKPDSELVRYLGCEFARRMLLWLGVKKLAEIDQANLSARAGVCCSHDHCDANAAMLAAWSSVLGRNMSAQCDADNALWAAAWSYAKREGFVKLAAVERPRYRLKYREAGKRAGLTRWASRPVECKHDAIDWMNANAERAFLPAFVETRGWKPETVAILG